MTDYTAPALRVNGIPIRCNAAGGGPTMLWEAIGESNDRTVSGMLAKTRRGLKRSCTAKTVPHAWDDAANIADLIEGKAAALTYDQAAPFLLNGWCPGVITGSGIAQSVPGPGAQSMYTPSGFQITTSTTSYIQWTGLAGLLSGPRGVTVNFWVRIPTGNPGFATTYVILYKVGGSDAGIQLQHDAGTGLTLHYGTYQVVASGAIANWANDMHMITGVIRDTTLTTYPCMSLYFDGVLKASLALPDQPFLYNDRNAIQHGPSTSTAATRMDELVVYPFPLNDAQVAGLYASMTRNTASSTAPTSPTPLARHQVATPPRVFLSGDGISDPFYAIGKVVGGASLPVYRDPVTQALVENARTLDLQFIEV